MASSVTFLDEDSIDEILYLARANEADELSAYLSSLSASTKRDNAEILAAAIDAQTKNTPLHYAAANGNVDVIKLLCPASTTNTSPPAMPATGLINMVNESGNTALHWAALNGHLESVKLLVHAGADVTIINAAGHDAVFEAEINDKGEVVDWLLAAVEELEKGIGREQGNGDSGEGSAGGVQDLSKEMEGLNTKATDGSQQGG